MGHRVTCLVRVRKEHEQLTMCFYNHWMDFPRSAYRQLKAASELNWENQVHGKNWAKRLAAMDGFEFTESHEEHGDTEHRYTITETEKGVFLEVFEKTPSKKETWACVFEGTMDEFIATYGGS